MRQQCEVDLVLMLVGDGNIGLFLGACATAGVHCTRASHTQIAVYSKAAVARLDEFVGPKT
jgi:hypothetical protein